jgi:hypothetical protein
MRKAGASGVQEWAFAESFSAPLEAFVEHGEDVEGEADLAWCIPNHHRFKPVPRESRTGPRVGFIDELGESRSDSDVLKNRGDSWLDSESLSLETGHLLLNLLVRDERRHRLHTMISTLQLSSGHPARKSGELATAVEKGALQQPPICGVSREWVSGLRP